MHKKNNFHHTDAAFIELSPPVARKAFVDKSHAGQKRQVMVSYGRKCPGKAGLEWQGGRNC